ncbi:DNA internalization-related competence protein ComEC/Rec2 [Ornithinibacillus halophilus]|uniref:Competence protein ComEC n=1 Tax=Ornithinibacillus halophilus TaxID=930117 RepID=A0A1M5DL94_9BACI|nr:DNA internalization-related competence protein ComEC/Rec2 [Ornithinibacillus halophilus]SHF67532.1 competence protein ComEC [Ornithinibacillus halophilus]
MKGYWHIVAITMALSAMFIVTDHMLWLVSLPIFLLILYLQKRLGKIAFILSLASILFFIFYIPSVKDSSDEFQFTKPIIGKITTSIHQSTTNINFRIKEESTNEQIQVTYFTSDQDYDLVGIQYGAVCEIQGDIEPVNGARNPGEFDYSHYLLTQGVSHQVIIESLSQINCETNTSILSSIFSFRDVLRKKVSEAYSEEISAWIYALVLGDDSHLSQDIIELFQRWSLSHLLAISGLHIGIIISVVFFILVKLNLCTKERAYNVLVLFLPCYALLAGGEPSVWRASLMVIFVILMAKFKWKTSTTDIISIVFIFLLILNPHYIYHIGFQFSFIVTFAILLSKSWILESNSIFWQMLRISFISQMILIPLQVTYFYYIQPLSILLNMIVVPYFSLVFIPLLFLLFILSPFHVITTHIATLLVKIHENSFLSLLKMIDYHLSFPWVVGSFPNLIIVIVYFVMAFLLMHFINQNKLSHAFKQGVGIVLLIVVIVLKPYFSPYGTVTVLDIGQGDAIVIELPYRKGVIFIDAGGTFSFEDGQATDKVFKQIIRPFLFKKGISKIDAVFLSHEDEDHVGSVDFMVDSFIIDTIFISDNFTLSMEQESHWKNSGTEIVRVGKGNVVHVNSQDFYVMGGSESYGNSNDNSLVLFSEIGGRKWLFTGDISKHVERNLLLDHPDLKVDVLKVAHHGSNTSTDPTFIKQIEPDVALISVGVNNMYGHPSYEVINTLDDENVQILRTDHDGAIIFHYTNEAGTFYRFLP